MSVENLKEYARRCADEPELRARARAIGMEDLDEHMKLAGTLGLDWTEDDMTAFSKEVFSAEGDVENLSEEDLEQIAGGVVTAAVVAMVVGGAVVLGASVALSAGANAGGDW